MSGMSSLTADTFTFEIRSPARQERYFASISLNMNPNCTYPGSHFSKGFLSSPECTDTFTGSFTIPELIHSCGFTDSSDSMYQTLAGSIHVEGKDPMGEFRGFPVVRTTKSVLNLNVRLPISMVLSTGNLTVASPIDALVAVTLQSYNYEADEATIEITTSVQWPYFLSSPSNTFNSQPSLQNIVLGLTDLNCPQDVPNSECLQVITMTISNVRNSSVCFLDGIYETQAFYNCRSGLEASSCPVDGSDTLLWNATLASENLCGDFQIDASLSGSLSSHQDSSFVGEKIAFLAGERLYFLASFSSDVEIISISIENLFVHKEGSSLQVVSGGGVEPNFSGVSFNFNEGAPPSGSFGFSFVATYGNEVGDLFQAGASSVFSLTVEASFSITYRTSFTKRDVLTEQVSLSSQLVLVTQA